MNALHDPHGGPFGAAYWALCDDLAHNKNRFGIATILKQLVEFTRLSLSAMMGPLTGSAEPSGCTARCRDFIADNEIVGGRIQRSVRKRTNAILLKG